MILIGMSGKKQSGKDSTARFLRNNAGVLWGNDEVVRTGPLHSFTRRNWPKVETLYVGGGMKTFAEGFGVPHELLWGTDEQKNTPIHIKWEQLPHYDRLVARYEEQAWEEARSISYDYEDGDLDAYFEASERLVPTGPMTARQFLQQIGEEMFLGMDPLYWVKQFERTVRASRADVVLVADPRKPEQITSIKGLGGIVFRFTRDPYEGRDRHVSEVALDEDRFDWANFDCVVDNRVLGIEATNAAVLNYLARRGLVNAEYDETKIDWNPRDEAVAA